jgi:hypothetical protein
VIETLNERFVSTWIIVEDIVPKLAADQAELATLLVQNHQYPFDFMFLSPKGELITRLTSFQDLRSAHPDVGHPHREGQESHADVFLATVAKYFGEN